MPAVASAELDQRRLMGMLLSWVFIVFVLVMSGAEGVHHPSSKRTSRTRCLLVSIDNRNLKPDYQAKDYTSMTSVITHAYADRHQYDYLYLQNNVTALEEQVKRLFPTVRRDPFMEDGYSKAVAKDIATALHVGYLQYRAASWAKLPVLWYIAHAMENRYDYVWYIDSDATVSPMHIDRSIEESIELWSRSPAELDQRLRDKQNEKPKAHAIPFNSYGQSLHNITGNFVRYGQKDLSKAQIIFFNNFPWRDNMPCAGSFIFRPTAFMERVFRQWWDFNMPSKNFKHFHEQDALWHMIESEYWVKIYHATQRGEASLFDKSTPGFLTYTSVEAQQWLKDANYQSLYLLDSSVYSIVSEIQFPSSHVRYEDLWLVHIASYNYVYRMPILYHFIKLISESADMEREYGERVRHIRSSHIRIFQPLELCLEMERRSQELEGDHRVTLFPHHNERTQEQWYSDHVSSNTASSPLPPATLHDGRLVHRKGSYWMISNGKKRLFTSYAALSASGLFDDFAVPLSPAEVVSIPDGDSIGVHLTAEEKAKLFHAYIPLKQRTAAWDQLEKQHESQVTAAPPTANACNEKPNEELSSLVVTNGTRARLFIISHSDESEQMVKDFIGCHYGQQDPDSFWMVSVRIESTPFFESIVYNSSQFLGLSSGNNNAVHKNINEQLPSDKENLSMDSIDYVITATYKTITKQLHYNGFTQTLDMISSLLRHAHAEDFDAVPFLRSGSKMMEFARYFHGGNNFQAAWDALLLAMGFSLDTIRGFDNEKVFYRNIYVMKTCVFQQIAERMRQAMELVVHNKDLGQLFAVDSQYKEGTEEVARRIFGTSYYQLHPFIFERLPSFFLYSLKAKVCGSTNGICKYNSR